MNHRSIYVDCRVRKTKQERRKEPKKKGSGRARDLGEQTNKMMYLWSNYGEGSNFLYSLAKAETSTDNSKWLIAILVQKKGGDGGGWWLVGLASRCSIRSGRTMSKSSGSLTVSLPPLSLSISLSLPLYLSLLLNSTPCTASHLLTSSGPCRHKSSDKRGGRKA